MADGFGLTLNGLVIKKLDDAKTEMETYLRTVYGNGVNLLPTSVLGQLVGMIAEREALLYELMEEVYNSFFPRTATGVSLDNVSSITAIKRLEATKGTGTGFAYGTLGTLIPAGSIVSVDGNPTARFVTTADATIVAGTNEVQKIQFSAVPDAGDWTLVFDGEETGTFAFNDVAATIQTSLNALSNLSAVTVSGDYTAGFTITFAGADGSFDQPLLQVGTNDLTNTGIQVNVNFTEFTKGVLPNVEIDLQAEAAGQIVAYANTLTVIESPLSGWDSFNNPTDVDPGNEIETDAEFRRRREITLSTAGAGTVDAIRARLLEIDEVEDARVFENDTDVTDVNGRPPHSFEAVVLGGDDQEIIDTIWLVKDAGIATDGDITGSAIDSMGFAHAVKFSRPDEIEIWLELDITVGPNFPVDGDETLKEQIVAYALTNFRISDDLIVYGTVSIASAIGEDGGVADIIDYVIRVGTTASPTLDDNISIADDEIAVLDTSRITVTII